MPESSTVPLPSGPTGWSPHPAPGLIGENSGRQLLTSAGVFPTNTAAAFVGMISPTPYALPSGMDPFQRSYQRKSLPVSKWKLKKYAGTDQELKLNEFLHLS